MDDGISWDECVTVALCQWAVSVRRWGEHRALVVARLLERRQVELLAIQDSIDQSNQGLFDEFESHSSVAPGNQSSSVGQPTQNPVPVFQDLLFRFLDTKAPVIGEISSQPFSESVVS